MTPRALVYFTQFTAALGGSEYIPLTFIAELQKRCRVTLALNWKSDVGLAARTMGIPVDMDALEIVLVKPENTLLRKLDAVLPFYRTWMLKKLAKHADLCISTVNMFDFGKPAHHFVFLLRHFGDNAFFDFVTHTKRSGFAVFRQKVRTLLAEGILRPLLGIRSTRKIIADRREHIYPNSLYVEKLMRDFYGDFNSTVFYPPTIFEPRPSAVPRDPLRVVCLGQIFPEKRVAEIIGIVGRARELSGLDVTLRIGGPLKPSPYVEKIRAMAAERPWVELAGGIYGDDKSDFLQSAAYAIHAERDEAFGISVTEYLKAGAIPLVPNEGGTVEIVDHPALTYRDDEDAARILVRLLTDEAFREECRLHCAGRAKEFTLQNYLKNQNILLNRIVDETIREAAS
ncbi:MAG: glycosyltransferase [Lentisphaeria bacterium]|nr:glycosyltransferase [Lentisphaeria bacterium]